MVRALNKFSRISFRCSTHPARDVGDVGAAVKLDVGAVLPDLRPQLDAVTGFVRTFPIDLFVKEVGDYISSVGNTIFRPQQYVWGYHISTIS